MRPRNSVAGGAAGAKTGRSARSNLCWKDTRGTASARRGHSSDTAALREDETPLRAGSIAAAVHGLHALTEDDVRALADAKTLSNEVERVLATAVSLVCNRNHAHWPVPVPKPILIGTGSISGP